MWKLLPLLAALAGPAPTAAGGARWAPSWAEAQKQAREQSRPLLLKFYTSWCGWCRKMDREAFRDPRIIEKSEKEMVFLALDAEDGGKGSELARKYGVRSFPSIVVLGSDGGVLARLAGYRTADRLLADLGRAGAARPAATAAGGSAAAKGGGDDPQALWELATRLQREQHSEEAARRFEELLAHRDPAARRYRDLALWHLAEIARLGNDRNRALELYQQLSAEHPDSSRAQDALYQLARLHHSMGNLDDAIASYETLVRRYPDGPYTRGVKVQLQILRQDYGRD